MNYVRTILITIAFLNMHYIHNGQAAFTSADSSFDDIDSLLQPAQETNAVEIKAIDKWNAHLELLTSEDEYWDTTTNNPTPDWKTKAFELAEEVIKQDKSLAETLKTDFITALNKKTTTFLDISNLITEFNKKIDALLSTPEVLPETTEADASTPPAPIVPEPIVPAIPEPVIEPMPVQTETSETTPSAQGETTAATNSQNNQEPNQEQLQQNWDDQLKKVKTEGENEFQIEDILIKTYEIARELLKSGHVKKEKLSAQLLDALEVRSTKGKLHPQNINGIMYSFNNSIGIPQSQFDQPYRLPEPPAFQPINPDQSQLELSEARAKKRDEDFEKLKKETEEKNAKLKELEKEQAEAKKAGMIALKAAQEAQDKGALAQKQVHEIAEANKKLKEEYDKKLEKNRQDMENARKSLMDYRQQMATAEKAEAEKGFFSKLQDWWQGTSTQKPGGLSSQEQDDLLAKIVMNVPDYLKEDAKEAFKDFLNTLFSFDNHPAWIAKMDDLIKNVVITYKLMEPKEILAFVENTLQKSGKISSTALSSIMSKIQTKMNQALAEKKHAKLVEQQKVQRRQEKKEQVLLAQQREKAEKERIEAEKQRRIDAANTYKQEKKHWYNLLNTVAQNKQATPQDNHAHLQEALQKSQSLLQLAGDIPHKNKPAISQKLKQKFSVALLEQQKNGAQGTNVYHNMDLFNKEINKMLD